MAYPMYALSFGALMLLIWQESDKHHLEYSLELVTKLGS